VEIRRETENGSTFSGVYAKVVRKDDGQIKLRVTHSNNEFKTFVEQLNG
jgi:hypothetical protein